MNMAELRSARVLRGGEMQVVRGNTVVVPLQAVGQLIDETETLITSADDGAALSAEEGSTLVSGTAALGLMSPGYGTYLEYAFGLGHRWDSSLRIGNGIQAVGLRRGWDHHPWYAAAGLRVGRNTGSAWFGTVDNVNRIVRVSDMRRFDIDGVLQAGVELGEWGRAWGGAKGIYSPYRIEIDADALGWGTASDQQRMRFWGGFIGGSVGFRWLHVAAELTVMRALGEVSLFGETHDLSGVVIAPSWGLQATY